MKRINFSGSKFLIAAVLCGSVLISSCEKEQKEPPKSMEQLQNENGLPITIEKITKNGFSKKLSFYSTLSGIKEATIGAPIGGKIEKINVKVGDYVKEDQIVVQFPTDSPSMQYEQAKAALELSEKLYKRMRALLETGEISQQSFDNAETQYLVDKRNYETIRQALFVEAPFDGIVTNVALNEGDNIKSETPILSIAQLNTLKTKIWLSDTEINQIKKGMVAKTKWLGDNYTGKVTEVSLSKDKRQQAFYAEIQFPNSDRKLKSGLTLDIDVVSETADSIFVLQRNYVFEEAGKKYVFIEKNGTAERREVKTGTESGIEVEIIDGLNEGDHLINCCFNKLENGMKVQVVK